MFFFLPIPKYQSGSNSHFTLHTRNSQRIDSFLSLWPSLIPEHVHAQISTLKPPYPNTEHRPQPLLSKPHNQHRVAAVFTTTISPQLACCYGDRHNCPHWLFVGYHRHTPVGWTETWPLLYHHMTHQVHMPQADVTPLDNSCGIVFLVSLKDHQHQRLINTIGVTLVHHC